MNKRQRAALDKLLVEVRNVATIMPDYARLPLLQTAEGEVRTAFHLFEARPLVEEVQLTLFESLERHGD